MAAWSPYTALWTMIVCYASLVYCVTCEYAYTGKDLVLVCVRMKTFVLH